VIRFLRGLLINHDTPHSTSLYPVETRSPPLVGNSKSEISKSECRILGPFIISVGIGAEQEYVKRILILNLRFVLLNFADFRLSLVIDGERLGRRGLGR
jgi:hypothetical protein